MANYVLIERIELNQSASSVTFSSIPQTGYTDLKIVLSARSTANGGQNVNLTFNSTASGYTDKILSGNGSTASSFSSGNTTRGGSCVIPGADFTASTFGNGEIYIPNYLGSNYKSFSSDSVTENNTTLSYAQMEATLWSNTAAINTILIDLSGGSFVAGSTFSLYGLAAVGTTPAIAPKADGGNVIATDGTYWYHAFLSNGTFTPQVGLSADVLVVAGGGGGATEQSAYGGAGGGGAGGVLGFAAQSLSVSNYTCTIGAGGAPGINATTNASNGINSSFGALTASVGGGGGGAGTGSAAPSGGSGGGGESSGTAGGSGTSGQGYAGGNGKAAPNYSGGGGGGAGGIGTAGSTSGGGAGGASVNTYTNATWLSTALSATGLGVSGYIAGGGGGGGYSPATGGTATGGGGAGATYSGANAVSGTANTGGGGGGGTGTGTFTGGTGGSGIIIVRYTVA